MKNNRGNVKVKFSIGFGNNLFQYCFSRLLSETNKLNFTSKGLPQIGLQSTKFSSNSSLETLFVNDKRMTEEQVRNLLIKEKNVNYVVSGYFEDFKLYKPHLNKIRSWFSPVRITNTKDLIVHIRLQNRLVQKNHHKNFITSKGYEKAFSKFSFDRLHIVTDADKWGYHKKNDILHLQKECKSGPNPKAEFVSVDESISYINELVDGFKKYDPIIHCKGSEGVNTIKGFGAHRSGFIDDFNLIRSFDKIIVYNSTFSWWAATLSEATKIGVFKLWKPNKGSKNKNLGHTDFPGWFSWGQESDLYYER